MHRWWDDAELARTALNRVDSSDVVQGVGTAVLAYHAIAKATIAPLSGRTLVDPQTVVEALSNVDREPVAKAFSAATEKVMGSAAEKYGELLADQIHSDAIAAVEQALRVWTSNGIPMPMAVERAADIVGVPTSRMGRYMNSVKPVTVAPVVRMDAADRALMEFASHVGNRENTSCEEPVQEDVQVSVEKSVSFRENEHPRDLEGRFAPKVVDEDIERKERMARRNNRMARNKNTLAQVASTAKTPSTRSLADIVAALKPATSEPAVAAGPRTKSSVRTSSVQAKPATSSASHDVSTPDLDPSIGDPPFDVDTEVRRSFRLVPKWAIESLLLSKMDFSTENLLKFTGDGLDDAFYDLDEALADDPDGFRSSLFDSHGNQMVAIQISGTVPVSDGVTPKNDAVGSRQDRFYIPDKEKFSFMGMSVESVDSNIEGAKPVPLLIYMFDYNGPELFKSLEHWNVDGRSVNINVSRDLAGRFSEQDELKARMARRARRRGQIQQVVRQSSLPPQVQSRPLSEVVSALAPSTDTPVRTTGTPRVREGVRVNMAPKVNPAAKPAPKPIAAPRTVGELSLLDFLSTKAVMLTESDFMRVFNTVPIDGTDGAQLRGRNSDDAKAIMRRARMGQTKRVISDYASSGDRPSSVVMENGKPVTFGYTGDDYAGIQDAFEEAVMFADQLEHEENDGIPPEYQNIHYEVQPKVDPTGTHAFEIAQRVFDATNPMVLMVGHPEAFNAVASRKRVNAQVFAIDDNLDPIVRKYNLPPGYFKKDRMPVTVILVEPIDW